MPTGPRSRAPSRRFDRGRGGRVAAGGGVDRGGELGVARRRDVDVGEAAHQRGRAGEPARRGGRDDPPVVGRLRLALGQRDRRAGEERGELAERAVEPRAVELVDDQPAPARGGVDDDAALPLLVARAGRRCRGADQRCAAVTSVAPVDLPDCAAAFAIASASVVLPAPAGPTSTTWPPASAAATAA